MFFQRAISLAFALALIAVPALAYAKGTARVEQSNGAVHVYQVSIRMVGHRTVRITSADRRGTLVIGKAACSYMENLQRCLPYRIVLEQVGEKRAIDFRRGTEYMNFTGSQQQLPFSSSEVPPHGLLLFLVTAHGTHITVRGTIDGTSA